MKTRQRIKKTLLEVGTLKRDAEMEEEVVTKEEEIVQNFLQESLTYENLIMYHWTKVILPSSLWAVHKELTGKFIAFSCLSENTSDTFVSTEKAIVFEGSLKAEIFLRGKKMDLSSLVQQNTDTLETLDILLKEVDHLDLCKGTGLEMIRYSAECCLILDRKYRNSRCSNCATKRTHLKKTEAQRLRRAAAKQKECSKNIVGSRKLSKIKEVEQLDDRDKEKVENIIERTEYY